MVQFCHEIFGKKKDFTSVGRGRSAITILWNCFSFTGKSLMTMASFVPGNGIGFRKDELVSNNNMENVICMHIYIYMYLYFWANLFRYFEDFLRGKNPCECVLRPRSEHKGSVLFLVFSQPSSYFSHDLSFLILLQSPIIWSHIFFIISSYIFHNCIIAYIIYYIIIQYIISQWHSSHYCFIFFTKTK